MSIRSSYKYLKRPFPVFLYPLVLLCLLVSVCAVQLPATSWSSAAICSKLMPQMCRPRSCGRFSRLTRQLARPRGLMAPWILSRYFLLLADDDASSRLRKWQSTSTPSMCRDGNAPALPPLAMNPAPIWQTIQWYVPSHVLIVCLHVLTPHHQV